MPLTVAPLDEHHLPALASLLAARHRLDRSRQPALSLHYESTQVAQTIVQATLTADRTSGVVALRDDQVVGYLIGTRLLIGPTTPAALLYRPRSIRIGYGGHAVTPDQARTIYQMLYAAAAAAWVTAGFFAHYISLPATDLVATAAWFALGFGQQQVCGIRAPLPLVPAPANPLAGMTVRRAGPSDRAEVAHLVDVAARHHAEAPTYYPYLPEAVPAFTDQIIDLFEVEQAPIWLALHENRAVGLMVAHPVDNHLAAPEAGLHIELVAIQPALQGRGIGTALLNNLLTHAAETGHRWCSVCWETANLIADGFWSRAGFQPVSARLYRRVDERVVWADGRRRG